MPPCEYWWIKGKSEFDFSGGWMIGDGLICVIVV
jgi:hypothetical protein